MTKEFKAVIFDLDGVICNTDKYHYKAWKAIADDLGIYFDLKFNEKLKGVGRSESLDIILEANDVILTEKEKLKLTDKKNKIYIKLLEDLSPLDLCNEVTDTLCNIKNRGIKVALGSSSKNAKLILKKIGLLDFFNIICDGNSITYSKPHPEIFLKAAEALGVSAEVTLVVEDAKAGIEAAHAAKMKCAAIGEGVKYNIADYNLKSFSKLLDIV